MITPNQVLESNILYQVQEIVPLGENWFREPTTGICYHIVEKDNKLYVDTVRYSTKLPTDASKYPKSKERVCPFCGELFRRKAQGNHKWCSMCIGEIRRQSNMVRQKKWRLKQKKLKEKTNEQT